MKRIVLALTLVSTSVFAAPQQELCQVQVCNKLERFTLDIWSHIKDNMGEQCFDIVMPKEQAVPGAVLSSESRWWQGSSINPTKKSVTRIKQVYQCSVQ
ncbi:hypothetical protein oselot_100 [Salmonella phage oselot]|uniref:Uncharacterized protein n=1 Tax=Salmonella phage oselot TaxID=2713309 RepID=A0A6G8RJI9_9CAUD|nr:hypothetical protein HWD27_gp167 [Salmonella phage oselot]QIO01577.1 hypothetical protein oselot_100 [Salmonella phage oselot]